MTVIQYNVIGGDSMNRIIKNLTGIVASILQLNIMR
jgi:hypothetical protein